MSENELIIVPYKQQICLLATSTVVLSRLLFITFKYQCIEKFNNLFTITDTLTPLYIISLFLFEYRYSVENAYLEEKEDTCNALGEISENSG